MSICRPIEYNLLLNTVSDPFQQFNDLIFQISTTIQQYFNEKNRLGYQAKLNDLQIISGLKEIINSKRTQIIRRMDKFC